MSAVQELQDSIGSAAAGVGPATVGLGRGWGRRSGVVIADGAVLTSAHDPRSDEVRVLFAGERRDGTFAGRDPELDLAVVRVDTSGVDPVEWGDPAAVTIGTPVIALADPGGRGLRATLGFASSAGRSLRSARGRRVGGVIEHTAPLPRGSSGGPLVGLDGRLLGVNSLRLEGGLILALPASPELRGRLEALVRGESVGAPRLGVAVAPPRVARRMRRAVGLPERDGLLVRGVEDGSPAATAGVEAGDLVVGAGGSELRGIDSLYAALESAGPGGKLELTVVRGSDERRVPVRLEEAA